MQLAAVFQRFEATESSISSEKVPTLGMYCFAIKSLHEQLTRVPLSFFADIGTKKERAVITWSQEQLCPRILKAKSLLYTLVDERWDIARGDRAISQANSARFPLIAKAAKIVLATPASEAICERLFKRAKHIGTTDRMTRLLDNTFEMLVMAQYNIARHGGVETIEVSIISAMTILYCLVTVTAALAWAGSWGFLQCLQLARRASLDDWLQLAFCMLFAAEKAHVTLVLLVSVPQAAFALKFG